ncbi:MAG: bifunctional D-glycero-beta-D-manno-heptose-7-phosphate kinase/D-glycero-beta-D-manno-heptose 1-phosphate adenylyltransferase HldE [Gammaproteobacteria bacterium]|nr:bifunctional D-glycero-beta-D-manno-heptose-7-phosphate kinase/D-glycero-beta-D-manno-heptose 1-phosphate adenylyltransferase HldE [Gammaproteobacteria bacterium]
MLKLPDFSSAAVLVVGDLMLDRYWHGATSRISPEAPVPVVKVEESEERAGGAGNVALNIAHLGGHTTLLGVTGEDEAGQLLKRQCEKFKVKCEFISFSDFTTITKLRVISRHQQLLRLDFEDHNYNYDDKVLSAEFERIIQSSLTDKNVIVLSDYAKGTLSQTQTLIQLANKQNMRVVIDPKGSSFEPYRGAYLLTPNLSEFEQIVGPCLNDEILIEKGQKLRQDLDLNALLITRSEQGMTLITESGSHHFPTHAQEVYDVTGAGDTVIAVLALALAAEMDLVDAVKLANIAAGIAVSKLGTATVSLLELQLAVRDIKPVETGIVDEQILADLVSECQLHGEKVIMTNGCFDILHAGHVGYLEQAKTLGDRLIVAVNDDDSIKRLKGEERPVNTMSRRMTVLAGLSCVDWVVGFYEDTPTRLICHLKPDVLVKGGDNDPAKIPGGDCVRDNGGEVLVMDYLDNCSTTGLIRTIRETDKGNQ